MKRRALERFREEFRRWAHAYNAAHGRAADADQLLAALESRMGDELVHIGAAFLRRWLVTEPGAGRGYFVRESDRSGPGGGQFTLIHRGDGRVDPCWELFVQLADYGRVRPIAGRCGQVVRLEDRLMDLTVRSGDILVLYIEHKEKAATATTLLGKMRRDGEAGFSLSDPDVRNDALRKSKYVARGRPRFFALSAIGYRSLFRVEYGTGNRFRLIDDGRPLSAPLSEHRAPAAATPPEPRSPIDTLASELERVSRVWISLGTGTTAFNVYLTGGDDGDAVVAGVSKAGRVWTDVKGLGHERAQRLAARLDERGVRLDTRRAWASWRLVRAASTAFTLTDSNAVAIAAAIGDAIGGSASDGLAVKTNGRYRTRA